MRPQRLEKSRFERKKEENLFQMQRPEGRRRQKTAGQNIIIPFA
jgi:hypothetical protein